MNFNDFITIKKERLKRFKSNFEAFMLYIEDRSFNEWEKEYNNFIKRDREENE